MTEKELLQMSLNEIKYLRERNKIMAARLDMFDAVMSALHGQPATQRDGLMHPDVVYEIEKQLATKG